MLELLNYNFMQHALVASLLVSIATGVIGAIIIANRLVFISGGIAHSAYGGVGLAWYMGLTPFLGALLFTVPMACLMGMVQQRFKERSDTLIGILWSGGMALGVILLDLTPGYKSDLMSFLFGSILTVPTNELWMMFGLDILLLVFIGVFYQQLLSASVDPEYAFTRELPVNLIKILILIMIALGVVIMMRITGLILMIALFTVPAAIGRRWVNSLRQLMLVSGIICLVLCLTGLMLAWIANLSSGASIIAVACAVYLCNLFILEYHKKRNMKQLVKSIQAKKNNFP